jgi:hypothetical protein
MGHVLYSGVSGVRNVDTLFFLFGWSQCSFHKKHAQTRYTEFVFLHPVRSMGHVVHSGASRPGSVDAQFVMLRWDRYRFHKKHVGTSYTEIMFLHLV